MVQSGKTVWVAVLSAVFASPLAMAKPVLESIGSKHWEATYCAVEDKDNSHETEGPACASASLDMPVWRGNAKIIAYIENDVRQELAGEGKPMPAVSVSWQQLLQDSVQGTDPGENDISVTPAGANEKLAAYFINTYSYQTGAAHGLPSSRAVVLDAQTGKPVMLDSILLGMRNMISGREKLSEIAKKHTARYFQQQDMTAEEVKEMMEGDVFPFKLTDNWRPVKGGIALLYQPYEIAPYASGMPDIFIPAEELQGIVRPEILKQLKDWPVAYDDDGNTQSQ